jgi:hypothetical protein
MPRNTDKEFALTDMGAQLGDEVHKVAIEYECMPAVVLVIVHTRGVATIHISPDETLDDLINALGEKLKSLAEDTVFGVTDKKPFAQA